MLTHVLNSSFCPITSIEVAVAYNFGYELLSLFFGFQRMVLQNLQKKLAIL